MANGTPPQPFRTDALNPSSLPTASLGHLRPLSSRPIQSSSTQPDVSHEEWNLRIDREVKAVVGGLEDLIDLSDVSPHHSLHLTSPRSNFLILICVVDWDRPESTWVRSTRPPPQDPDGESDQIYPESEGSRTRVEVDVGSFG